MDFILNEKKEAIRILKTGNLGKRVGKGRIILIKYLHHNGEDKVQIRKTVEDISKLHDSSLNVNRTKFADYLDKIVDKYADNKYMLKETELNITKQELAIISSASNLVQEKVLFILLVYAKSKDGIWCNESLSSIFPDTGVKLNTKDQDSVYHKLFNKNFFEFSNKCDKLGMKLTYINEYYEDYEIKFSIDGDLDNVILYYLRWKGHKIINCSECGVLVEAKNNKSTYCVKCSKKIKNAQDVTRMAKKRNSRK